jgi:hypothetical protein
MGSVITGSEDSQFEPASEDIHDAVLCEFKDLGVVDTPYGDKHQGLFVFQVEEENDLENRKEVRFFFNMTLGTESYPSKIRKIIEKWRGKSITDDEHGEGFDLESLVGKPCRLDVSHRESQKGRTYAQVDSIAKAGKNKIKPEEYVPLDERKENTKPEDDSSSDDDEDDDIPF